MAYRHIVLFRIHDGVPDDEVVRAERALAALADRPGVLEWTVRRSDDERKGVVIVENGLFADRAAFEAFRDDEHHRAAGELLAAVADWWVGDYPQS